MHDRVSFVDERVISSPAKGRGFAKGKRVPGVRTHCREAGRLDSTPHAAPIASYEGTRLKTLRSRTGDQP